MKTIARISLLSIFALALMNFQLIKTQLVVTVRNELGNTEEGVKVQLYETEEDYKAEKNAAFEGVTDKKGVVRFKELKPASYFLLARKDDKDNFGGGEQTGKLNENEISAIKTVIQKLKTKSNIDIQRLNIVNEALDKVKKFGLKV